MHLLPCISEAAIYSLSIDHCVLPHRSHSMFHMIIACCVQEMTWKKTGDYRRRKQEFRSFISHSDNHTFSLIRMNVGDEGLGIEMKMSCCNAAPCSHASLDV